MSDRGLDSYYGWYLATVYGDQSQVILDKMSEFQSVDSGIALARAEAWFTTHHEMVNSASDFFVRRTGRLYFDIGSIAAVRATIMQDLQDYLNWDADRRQKEEDILDMLLFDATHYYDEELS